MPNQFPVLKLNSVSQKDKFLIEILQDFRVSFLMKRFLMKGGEMYPLRYLQVSSCFRAAFEAAGSETAAIGIEAYWKRGNWDRAWMLASR